MNCRKVKRLVPFIVGSDLPRSKISSVQSHLNKCSRCQQEYEIYTLSLEKTKEWLTKGRQGLDEREWKSIIQKALKKESHEISPRWQWPIKKHWVYTFVVMTAVLFTLIITNLFFIKKKIVPREGTVPAKQIQLSKGFEDESQQKMLSMTLVSQETGLKIKWFFIKNFELEVEE